MKKIRVLYGQAVYDNSEINAAVNVLKRNSYKTRIGNDKVDLVKASHPPQVPLEDSSSRWF